MPTALPCLLTLRAASLAYRPCPLPQCDGDLTKCQVRGHQNSGAAQQGTPLIRTPLIRARAGRASPEDLLLPIMLQTQAVVEQRMCHRSATQLSHCQQLGTIAYTRLPRPLLCPLQACAWARRGINALVDGQCMYFSYADMDSWA